MAIPWVLGEMPLRLGGGCFLLLLLCIVICFFELVDFAMDCASLFRGDCRRDGVSIETAVETLF